MDTSIKGSAEERKQIPVYSGFIKYFPDAIVEVTKRSLEGNLQHHPDKPLFWDKTKSADELDAMMRHLIEQDWVAVAWRAMANLQRECDKSVD
jgi:hypothetical protein|tara:strand:+ start:517 stop:795 length:279 start_codon:yes stop_codon:yes gene_type:complete